MTEPSPMTTALNAAIASQNLATPHTGDPLDTLPAASRLKLEQAQADRAGAHAAYLAASDGWQDARAALGRAEGFARSRLELPGGIEHVHPAGAALAELEKGRTLDARTAAVLAPVSAAKAKLAAATAARDRAASRQAAYSFLEGVEDWLARHTRPGVQFEAASPVQLGRVRDIVSAVAQCRDELSTLDEQFAAVEVAPLPAGELRRRAVAEVDAAAAKSELAINPRSRSATPLGLAQRLSIGARPGSNNSTTLVGDAGSSLFTSLMRTLLTDEVDRLLAASASAFDGALSDSERDQRFSELAALRLQVERREEALICAAEAEGRIIQRRPDVDPRAFLNIVG